MALAIREISRKWFLCFSKLLTLEWVETDTIPIGATDGRRLLLNPTGVSALASMPNGREMLVFLLCHEALHALLGHPWRSMALANKRVANEAADYIINAMIKDRGMAILDGCLYNPTLSGDKSMEQLYRELLNTAPPQTGLMSGDLIPVTLAPDESLQDVVDQLEAVNESIIVQDRAHAKATGTTATRCADRGSVTVIRWQDVLWGLFTKKAEPRWSSPINRPLYTSSGLVCFGRAKRTSGSLAVAIDTSGSVSQQMLSDFLAEVESIRSATNPVETHVLSVSHEVCDYRMLAQHDVVPATLQGGGGTNFQPAFDYLADKDVVPDALIYLTDGYACDGTRLRAVDYPVFWVTTGATNMNIGEVIAV